MKNIKEFKITAVPFDVELITGMMWNLPIDGITENVNFVVVFSKEDNHITKEDIQNIFQPFIDSNALADFSVEENVFEDRNWNEEWEKNVPIIEISDKIVIKPSFREYENTNGKTIIEIDPKMSFGTGEHQTTKLILSIIDKYTKPGQRVLDVGSGTGVLAIAAAKLSDSQFVLGIDNDEWCLLNGNENVQLNKLNGKVEIRLAELNQVAEADFDLITANINKHVLKEINKELKSKLSKNGILILSGLLLEDEEEIKSLYQNTELSFIYSKSLDEWITLVFQNKD